MQGQEASELPAPTPRPAATAATLSLSTITKEEKPVARDVLKAGAGRLSTTGRSDAVEEVRKKAEPISTQTELQVEGLKIAEREVQEDAKDIGMQKEVEVKNKRVATDPLMRVTRAERRINGHLKNIKSEMMAIDERGQHAEIWIRAVEKRKKRPEMTSSTTSNSAGSEAGTLLTDEGKAEIPKPPGISAGPKDVEHFDMSPQAEEELLKALLDEEVAR